MIWTKNLTPITKRGEDAYETLVDRYESFTSNILFSDNHEQSKKYRERLLGPDLIAGVTDEYSIMRVIEKIGYDNWQEMTLSERGKWCAWYDLENMAELLREHLRTQKQLQEEQQHRVTQSNKANR